MAELAGVEMDIGTYWIRCRVNFNCTTRECDLFGVEKTESAIETSMFW